VQYADAVAMLRGIPLFEKLDPARLRFLAFSSAYMTFHKGESLLVEGDPSDSAFVIQSGEVEILVGVDGQDTRIGTLGRHQLVGEMGIILNSSRTATIRALGPVEALRIDGEMFLQAVTENPQAALTVMRILSEKLARLTEEYERLKGQARGCTEAIDATPQ